jgi:hypothetical protein
MGTSGINRKSQSSSDLIEPGGKLLSPSRHMPTHLRCRVFDEASREFAACSLASGSLGLYRTFTSTNKNGADVIALYQ